MADTARSRRSALEAIGLCLAGAAGLWRFLTPRPAPAGGPGERVITLAAGDVPADGALVLPEDGVAVVRQGSAFLALDLACTHLGCTVTATRSGFACPCHGSRFGPSGAVLAGPAPRPLRELPLAVADETVRVSLAQRPPAGRPPCARTPRSGVS